MNCLSLSGSEDNWVCWSEKIIARNNWGEEEIWPWHWIAETSLSEWGTRVVSGLSDRKLSEDVRKERPCCLLCWIENWVSWNKERLLFCFVWSVRTLIVLSRERLLLCFVQSVVEIECWLAVWIEVSIWIWVLFCEICFELRIESQGRGHCCLRVNWSSLSWGVHCLFCFCSGVSFWLFLEREESCLFLLKIIVTLIALLFCRREEDC